MIKQLTEQDRQLILDFAYQKEHESIFIIGSLNKKNAFELNKYIGYFENDVMKGLAVCFTQWGNLNVHSNDPKTIEALVDYIIEKKCWIKDFADVKKYADVVIERLKTHNIHPKKVEVEYFSTLKKENFTNFAEGDERQGSKEELDEIILMDRGLNLVPDNEEITELERNRTKPSDHFLLKIDKIVVSKAALHGYTDNYFQIGGVFTQPEHRGKGYAKRCVSYLCRHFFETGKNGALIFSRKDNTPANKVYESIGFRQIGDFVLARY